MKARVKTTGKIVEARRIGQSSQGTLWEAEGSNYYQYELDFNMKEPPKPPYDPDYWTRLEHTYAGMAMQGMLSNPEVDIDYKSVECMPQAVASTAYIIAHALVEKMKETK